MTKDDIIRMAREAGLVRTGDGWTEPHRWGMTEIEHLVELARADEREACAKVCEDLDAQNWSDFGEYKTGYADAIRAREYK